MEHPTSQLSEYVVMNSEKARKATEGRLWHFSKFLFPVILLNTVKEAPEKKGCTQRDAGPKSNRQWDITLSGLIDLDFKSF